MKEAFFYRIQISATVLAVVQRVTISTYWAIPAESILFARLLLNIGFECTLPASAPLNGGASCHPCKIFPGNEQHQHMSPPTPLRSLCFMHSQHLRRRKYCLYPPHGLDVLCDNPYLFRYTSALTDDASMEDIETPGRSLMTFTSDIWRSKQVPYDGILLELCQLWW